MKFKRVSILQIIQKTSENYCLAYIYQLTKFGDLVVSCGSKIYSEMHPVSSTNTHHDVTDLGS